MPKAGEKRDEEEQPFVDYNFSVMMLVVKAAPVFAANKGGRSCSMDVAAPNEHAASHCLRFGRL